MTPKNGTQLKDRFLWNDGSSTVTANSLEELLKKGVSTKHLFVDQITADIEVLNRFLPSNEKIKIKECLTPLDLSWNIPNEYRKLNVVDYVSQKLIGECSIRQFSDAESEKRIQRVSLELNKYKSLGLFDVLRTIIYIINTFEQNNVIWGVGRGSSVHSYVLFLIGVHDIDSVDYDLNVEEFLR